MFLILYHLILYSLFSVFQHDLQKSLYYDKQIGSTYLDDVLCTKKIGYKIPDILKSRTNINNGLDMLHEIQKQKIHIKTDPTYFKNILTNIGTQDDIDKLESIRKQLLINMRRKCKTSHTKILIMYVIGQILVYIIWSIFKNKISDQFENQNYLYITSVSTAVLSNMIIYFMANAISITEFKYDKTILFVFLFHLLFYGVYFYKQIYDSDQYNITFYIMSILSSVIITFGMYDPILSLNTQSIVILLILLIMSMFIFGIEFDILTINKKTEIIPDVNITYK